MTAWTCTGRGRRRALQRWQSRYPSLMTGHAQLLQLVSAVSIVSRRSSMQSTCSHHGKRAPLACEAEGKHSGGHGQPRPRDQRPAPVGEARHGSPVPGHERTDSHTGRQAAHADVGQQGQVAQQHAGQDEEAGCHHHGLQGREGGQGGRDQWCSARGACSARLSRGRLLLISACTLPMPSHDAAQRGTPAPRVPCPTSPSSQSPRCCLPGQA